MQRLTWRTWWDRLRRGPDIAEGPGVVPFTSPRRILPVRPTPPSPVLSPPTWSAVLRTVRQWPSGMPITSDLLAQRFGVGRGQAWRWLQRLERAGLVRVVLGPPDRHGIRRKQRFVS